MSTIQVANITGQPTSNLGIVNTTSLGVSGATTLTGAATFSNTVTFASDIVPATSYKRNRIINGNMLIDQRNAGATITPTSGQYLVDRWMYIGSQASKFNAGQNLSSATPPTGFSNYQGFLSLAATSLAAGDYYAVRQFIEGYNVADLGWGAAGAKSITLSFWAYSSLTGTFGASLYNSAGTRSYPFTYSIPSANTWTQVSVTVVGDTSGTWLTTNGIGIGVNFGLGVGTTVSGTAGAWASGFYLSATGAVSVVGTSGATFYITGVQLEVGTKATPYEMQIYSDQLAQCQRYYQLFGTGNLGRWGGATNAECTAIYKVVLRAAPTISIYGNGAYSVTRIGTSGYSGTGATLNYAGSQTTGTSGYSFNVSSTGASANEFCGVGSDFLHASAEL